jgi:hypothetical protein
MEEVLKISSLERKYMDKIWTFLTEELFLADLRKIEKYIQANYDFLDTNYQIKNKLQLAAERLLNFYLFKNLGVIDIYPSPISSDMALFTDDALINIDAKTIDLAGNRGDDSFIQFSPHQISFHNKPLYSSSIKGVKFQGIGLEPGLPVEDPYSHKPCLTFFMGITYEDNNTSFKISHIKLSCVPNGVIVKEIYDNNVIQNFKTYRYLRIEAAKKVNFHYIPIEKSTFKEKAKDFIPFKLKKGEIDKENPDSWLDTSIKNPFTDENYVVWRLINNKYHVCLGGNTARIRPEIFKSRKIPSDGKWVGVRKKVFN